MAQTDDTQFEYNQADHPWLEMPDDDSLDEAVRYSLDEIRVG